MDWPRILWGRSCGEFESVRTRIARGAIDVEVLRDAKRRVPQDDKFFQLERRR